MTKTILIADNLLEFLATRREFLESAGYRVLVATSPEETIDLLRNEWVHLAILDIRLTDNDDANDESGLQIAKAPEFRHIPKIMLTSYPSYESVREAMGQAAAGLPPAVDYLGKIEGPQAMLDAVDSALAKHLRLNWDLQIHWTDQWPAELAGFIALLSSQVSSTQQDQLAQEAEDLLRRLFLDFSEISIGRILWRRPGRAAVIMFAINEQGQEQQFFVTCGAVAAIAASGRVLTSALGCWIPHPFCGELPSPKHFTLLPTAMRLPATIWIRRSLFLNMSARMGHARAPLLSNAWCKTSGCRIARRIWPLRRSRCLSCLPSGCPSTPRSWQIVHERLTDSAMKWQSSESPRSSFPHTTWCCSRRAGDSTPLLTHFLFFKSSKIFRVKCQLSADLRGANWG